MSLDKSEPITIGLGFRIPHRKYRPEFWSLLMLLPQHTETEELSRELAVHIIGMDFMRSKDGEMATLVAYAIPFFVAVAKASDPTSPSAVAIEKELIRLLWYEYKGYRNVSYPFKESDVQKLAAWGLGEVGTLEALRPLRRYIWNWHTNEEETNGARVSIAAIQSRYQLNQAGHLSLAKSEDEHEGNMSIASQGELSLEDE